MRLARLSRVVLILAVAAIELNCGETFRPIALPQNPNPPDPQKLDFALVLSTNGPDVCSPPSGTCDTQAHPGGASRIDVSGDSNVGTATVGLVPVHAALIPPGRSQAYVANKLEDTISFFATGTPATVTTISLPPGSAPVFVHTTQTDTVYSANSGLNTVSVISVARNVVTKTIPVGVNPVALAETQDGKKMYVVNQGSSTVTVITTVDDVAGTNISVTGSPSWAAARLDSRFVYVLGSGVITAIDTNTDVPVPLTASVPNASFAFLDPELNRIYLTTTDNKLLTVDVSEDAPIALPAVDLSPVCSTGCVLDSVTTLPSNGQVYVASHSTNQTVCSHLDGVPDDAPPCVTTNVFVLQAATNMFLKTITTLHNVFANGALKGSKTDFPVVPFCETLLVRRHIAPSSDGSKVYVANCDAGGTDIIKTADSSFVLNLPAPVSSLPPIGVIDPTLPPPPPPPQRPTFVLPAGKRD